MLSDKSVLLGRINIAIKKKWHRKSADNSGPFGTTDTIDHVALTDRNYLSHSKNAASIERLEERIEALEKQQDQLFCFIDFLLENLPDLVINSLRPDQHLENGFNHQVGSGESIEAWSDTQGCCEKNDPCPTRREKDVLELLVKGFCAKEIANKLFISETTVITHKKNLKEKFNAKNTVELIAKAQSHLSKINK